MTPPGTWRSPEDYRDLLHWDNIRRALLLEFNFKNEARRRGVSVHALRMAVSRARRMKS